MPTFDIVDQSYVATAVEDPALID